MHISLPNYYFLVFKEWVPIANLIASRNWFPYATIGVLVQFLQVASLTMWHTRRHIKMSYLSTLIGY
jgi:hypothetical protein